MDLGHLPEDFVIGSMVVLEINKHAFFLIMRDVLIFFKWLICLVIGMRDHHEERLFQWSYNHKNKQNMRRNKNKKNRLAAGARNLVRLNTFQNCSFTFYF